MELQQIIALTVLITFVSTILLELIILGIMELIDRIKKVKEKFIILNEEVIFLEDEIHDLNEKLEKINKRKEN